MKGIGAKSHLDAWRRRGRRGPGGNLGACSGMTQLYPVAPFAPYQVAHEAGWLARNKDLMQLIAFAFHVATS